MGEEAATPLLVPGNDGDDPRLDLTLGIHGDDDQRKAAGEAPGLPPASSAARHALLGLDWAEVTGQLGFAAPMVATSMAYYAIPLVSVMFAGRLGDLQLQQLLGHRHRHRAHDRAERLAGDAVRARIRRSGVPDDGRAPAGVAAHLRAGLRRRLPPLALLGAAARVPETSRLAADFLRHSVPALFAYGFIQCALRFLQAQSVVAPLVAFSLLPLAAHVGVAHALVNVLGMGFAGAAVATSVSLWMSFLMLAAYVRHVVEQVQGDMAGTHNGGLPTRPAWHEARHPLRGHGLVSLISSHIVRCQLLKFVVVLPESQLSTSIIAMCQNTEAISYMISYGFTAVISTRVSNELGAQNIANAKKALKVSLALSLMLGVAFLLLLGLGHEVWVSSEAVVIHDAAAHRLRGAGPGLHAGGAVRRRQRLRVASTWRPGPTRSSACPSPSSLASRLGSKPRGCGWGRYAASSARTASSSSSPCEPTGRS